MTTTFLATDPTGAVHQRKSENRTYTHAILVRPSYEAALKYASTHQPYPDVPNFEYYSKVVNGTSPYSQSESEIATAKDHVDGCADASAYMVKMSARRVADVEARKAKGDFDTFQARTWCGRPDLAQKELATAARFSYAEVLMVEVTVKAKRGAK